MSRYTREDFDKCSSPHDSNSPSITSNSQTIITHSPPTISKADAQARPPTSRAIYDESSGFGTNWYINLLSDDLSPQPVSEVLSGPKHHEAAVPGSRHYAKKSRISNSNAGTQSREQPDKDDALTAPENSVRRTENQNTRGSQFSHDFETSEGPPHVDGPTITEDFMLPFENRQARVSRFVRSRDTSGKFDLPRMKEFRVPPIENRKTRGPHHGTVSNTKEKPLKYEDTEELSLVGHPTMTDFTFPLESRNARPSRFTSNTISLKFEAAESLPQPYDEKKVLTSIHYARLELASLRKNRAQDELTIQQLENRIAQEEGLETRRPTADSALGSADEGSQQEEKISSHRKLLVEKNRLESIVQALQSEADKATRDHNSTLVELRVAKSTIERLKAHNQSLEEINSTLKRNIERILENQAQDTTFDTTTGSLVFEESGQRFAAEQGNAQMENELNFQQDEEVSQNHEKQCLDQLEVSQSSFDEHSYSQQSSNAHVSEEARQQQQWCPEEDRQERLRLDHEKPQEKPTKQRKPVQKWPKEDEVIVQDLDQEKHEGLKAEENSNNKQTTKKSPMADSHSSSEAGDANPAAPSSAGSSDAEEQGSARDLTYVSALSFGSLRDLRTTIEKERKGRRHRSRAPNPDSRRRAVRQSSTTEAIPPDGVLEPNVTDRDDSSHESKADITTEDVCACRKAPKPGVAIKESGSRHQSIQHSNLVEKVACLTEGIIVTESSYEEEPTIRPSQPPALALASVIQGLEEELSRAKQEFAHYQDIYNQQNPTIGKRARHSLKEKIEVLFKDIDVKADYIYSLYDVVEGQKQRSKEEQQDSEAADEMVRLTLESMGIQAVA